MCYLDRRLKPFGHNRVQPKCERTWEWIGSSSLSILHTESLKSLPYLHVQPENVRPPKRGHWERLTESNEHFAFLLHLGKYVHTLAMTISPRLGCKQMKQRHTVSPKRKYTLMPSRVLKTEEAKAEAGFGFLPMSVAYGTWLLHFCFIISNTDFGNS